jgi:leucine dehydrogenase
MSFQPQRVVVERGHRSGVPIVVAVHSTVLGQAIGGCRLAAYPDWRDGLDDALRLSAAMTGKAALAGLPHGGGKTVIALPAGHVLTPARRRDALLDAGDVIAGLHGTYATGPDVGTGPADMVTIGERTQHVFCRPAEAGGSGDSSPHTAAGVLAALRAVAAERFGSPDLTGRSFAVLGLGRVGTHVLRLLASAGAAHLVAADVDPARREVAAEYGATWTDPHDCLTAEVDVRGILWAPDVVVSAGGIVHAVAAELHHETEAQISARIDGIGDTLAKILHAARETSSTPAAAATRLAEFLASERTASMLAAC